MREGKLSLSFSNLFIRLIDANSVIKGNADNKSFVVKELEKTVSNLVFFDLKYA
jgi:hypothetical protein